MMEVANWLDDQIELNPYHGKITVSAPEMERISDDELYEIDMIMYDAQNYYKTEFSTYEDKDGNMVVEWRENPNHPCPCTGECEC